MTNALFKVEFVNLGLTEQIGFSKVSGISYEQEMIEYREISRMGYGIHLPGISSIGEVTLEGGVAPLLYGPYADSYTGIYSWAMSCKTTMDTLTPGGVIKSDVIISAYSDGMISASFVLKGALPKSIEISDFDATSPEILIETMVLVVDDFWRSG